MSKKEQGGIVLQKKHIVIGIIAAVVIIVTAVLAGMKPAIRLSACRPTSKPYRWRC